MTCSKAAWDNRDVTLKCEKGQHQDSIWHNASYIKQYIISINEILKFNSFNITSKQGVYFTVKSLGNIHQLPTKLMRESFLYYILSVLWLALGYTVTYSPLSPTNLLYKSKENLIFAYLIFTKTTPNFFFGGGDRGKDGKSRYFTWRNQVQTLTFQKQLLQSCWTKSPHLQSIKFN